MNIIRFLIPKNSTTFLEENNTLRQGLEKMIHYGFSAIPVISREGKYIGTVREGDFLQKILDSQGFDLKHFEKIYIKDIVKEGWNLPVQVISTEMEVMDRIKKQNFVPVIDDRGIFVGIITRKDIIQYFC